MCGGRKSFMSRSKSLLEKLFASKSRQQTKCPLPDPPNSKANRCQNTILWVKVNFPLVKFAESKPEGFRNPSGCTRCRHEQAGETTPGRCQQDLLDSLGPSPVPRIRSSGVSRNLRLTPRGFHSVRRPRDSRHRGGQRTQPVGGCSSFRHTRIHGPRGKWANGPARGTRRRVPPAV